MLPIRPLPIESARGSVSAPQGEFAHDLLQAEFNLFMRQQGNYLTGCA